VLPSNGRVQLGHRLERRPTWLPNFKKAQILQDQAALSLFTMPDDTNLPELIELRRKYLELRRQEELTNLRRRIALGNLEEAKQKAEAARVSRVNSDEVARAMRHRVPPPPMAAPTSPVTVPPLSPTGDVAPLRSPSPDCNSPGSDGHGDSEFHVASTQFGPSAVQGFGSPTAAEESQYSQRHVDVGGGRAVDSDDLAFSPYASFYHRGEILNLNFVSHFLSIPPL
jgi:hypothetical protein